MTRPPIPTNTPGEAVTIQPGVYPVLPQTVAKKLARAVRDPKVAAAAQQVVAASSDDIRGAVMKNVDGIEAAAKAGDITAIYREAHEIRGLAGNAGLEAAARIANGLCRYLDALSQASSPAEQAVVRLHIGAICRAARAEDEGTRLGSAVANELAQLVALKLAEINTSETR